MNKKRLPFQALQGAVCQLLENHIQLENGDLVPVFEYLPTKTKPPYIMPGDIQIVDRSTKDTNLYIVDMNIEVYSIKQTRSEINDMLDDIATLMSSYAVDMSNQNFQIIDQSVVDAQTSPSELLGYSGFLHVQFLIQDMEV